MKLVEDRKLWGLFPISAFRILDELSRRPLCLREILSLDGRKTRRNLDIFIRLGLVKMEIVEPKKKQGCVRFKKMYSLTDRGRRFLEALEYAFSFIEEGIYESEYWSNRHALRTCLGKLEIEDV